LLKPEVAKQLMPEVGKQSMPIGLGKAKAGLVSGIVGWSRAVVEFEDEFQGGSSRVQQSTPRITPVSGALVAAATKPTRDPRLLRQQTDKTSNGTNSSTSSGVSLGSKTAILDSNNKVVTNTKSVRDGRVDARLVNKDNAPPSQNKLDKSKTFPKSRQSEQKPIKPSRSKNVADTDAKAFSVKSSVSLLDSPTKSKSDKSETKSPTKSPSRHKKKDHNDKKGGGFKEAKRERDAKGHKIEACATFKGGAKGKNRNYIRRNRSPSYSPEPSQDTDLRLAGPPEKQARMQIDPDDKSSSKAVDVDLRQLNEVAKKRTSTENLESGQNKKSKSEVFDALFGNEDTDLRLAGPPEKQARMQIDPDDKSRSKSGVVGRVGWSWTVELQVKRWTWI
jgi:hypothetical protein